MTGTTADARRSLLALGERLRALPAIDRDLHRLATDPDFPRWQAQIRATGGCAHPVYLTGHTTTTDKSTGEVLRHFDTANEPGGQLAVRCRNRRASRCAPCSWQYAGDTYQVIRSGLSGGKGVPDEVADHPRLFVTLTAPSFGPVHRATGDGSPCRPRRGTCEHGMPTGCHQVHGEGDPLVGQPLCPACYNYPGHVLWHAHTRPLWDAFTKAVRRRLAALGGLSTRQAAGVRVVFAKVAEYQKRGAVHFHAVVRLDGPDGPGQDPPAWASADLLAEAIRYAVGVVRVTVPYAAALGEIALAWGEQCDITALRADEGALSDDAVAAYVAKYTTKSVGDAGGVDRRITAAGDIDHLPVNTHIRTLIATCWRLGGLPELAGLRLRAWAHMLGYRGHCLTKSRRYSTTYGELRGARTAYRRQQAGALFADWEDNAVTESAWRYLGCGHTPGEALIAAGIAEDLAHARQMARELRALGEGSG